MTKFNPDNRDDLTHRDCLKPLTIIENKEDAIQYFEQYTKYMQNKIGKSAEEVENVCKSNLNSYVGFCAPEVGNRLATFFKQ